MRHILLLIISLLAVLSKAQVTKSEETAQTAVVMDLETGEIVASYNPYMMLTPASLTKLITTAAGLELLGEDYTFKTFFCSGEKNNLYIYGYGDPTIESKYFKDNTFSKIVSQLKENFKIEGEKYEIMLVDKYFSGAPYLSKRLWEDMGNYYGAPYKTFNVGDNTQVVHLSSGAVGNSVWQSTTRPSQPQSKQYIVDEEKMDVYAKAYKGKSDSAYIYGIGTEGRYISGAIPANEKDFQVKAAMGDTEKEFALRLTEALVRAGYAKPEKVTYDSPVYKGSLRTLLRYESPKLLDIVRVTNQKSINLFADAICFALGAENREDMRMSSSWDAAMIKLRQYTDKSMGTEVKAQLYDGAGLSPMNAISAYQMASMLRFISKQPYYEAYRSTLAVAGESGTLATFGKSTPLEGKVIGKSGSMTGVTAYAGYILHKYSFCIIFNHSTKSRTEQRREMVEWLKRWGL